MGNPYPCLSHTHTVSPVLESSGAEDRENTTHEVNPEMGPHTFEGHSSGSELLNFYKFCAHNLPPPQNNSVVNIFF